MNQEQMLKIFKNKGNKPFDLIEKNKEFYLFLFQKNILSFFFLQIINK